METPGFVGYFEMEDGETICLRRFEKEGDEDFTDEICMSREVTIGLFKEILNFLEPEDD